MKKIVAAALAVMLVFAITACESDNSQQNTAQQKDAPAETSDNQSKNQTTAGENTILVAYFSYSGNTKQIAEQIQKQVGGDLFEIKTASAYPSDYDEVVDQAQKEQEEDARPELDTHVETMDDYDMVFIGFPNWWGTMPMPLFTFLEEYDFSGKTIIPFCTHGGSAFGQSIEDMQEILPEENILEGLSIRDTDIENASSDVTEWLRGLDMIQ